MVGWARHDFTLLFGGPVFISTTVSDVLLSPSPLNSAVRSLDKEMVKTLVPAVFICAFVGDADQVPLSLSSSSPTRHQKRMNSKVTM